MNTTTERPAPPHKKGLSFLPLILLAIAATAQYGPRLWEEWSTNPNAEHVFLALPAALGILALRLKRLQSAHSPLWITGGICLATATFALYLDNIFKEPALLALGLWIGGIGSVALLTGKKGLRHTLFPFFLLAFSIPAPQAIARSVFHIHLQRLASACTAGLLDLFGFNISITGTWITINNQLLAVGEQCSGLQFQTLLLFGACIIGWLMVPRRHAARIVIALAALPIAFVANIIRLCAAAFILDRNGPIAMDDFLHQSWSVLIPYAFGIAALVALAGLIKNSNFHEPPTIISEQGDKHDQS